MRIPELYIIAAPKAELRTWWDRLDPTGHDWVRSYVGRLLPLLEIETHCVVRALAHVWCPETCTFMFGDHELTPTLEEYSVAMGKPLVSELIGPPIGAEHVSTLSDFLRVKEGDVRKVLKANRKTCPFSFLNELFQNAPSFQKNRIFLLAFFGFVLFPHCRNAINPSMAWVVREVCMGKGFVNAVLTETFLSLTRFKENKNKTFHAPPELLQIWFFSHVKGFGSLMTVNDISDSHHPLLKFKDRKTFAPDYHYSEWLAFMTNPGPEDFQWHAK